MAERGCRLDLGYIGWEGDNRMMREKNRREKEREKVFIQSRLHRIYELGCVYQV
jgi:hypothetical protein